MTTTNQNISRRGFAKLIAKAVALFAVASPSCERATQSSSPVTSPLTCLDGKSSEEYEYVIVGSGAGGGPLAANLARKGHSVLLVEAGGDEESENYRMPLRHPQAAEDPAMRWDFFVRHYENDAQARMDPKFVDKKDGVLYPRAGTLGGCTAVNDMILVYPHNSNWDYIAELTGDTSWNSENMRRYFERMENCQYMKPPSVGEPDPARHGFQGWLPTNAPSLNAVLGVLRNRQLRTALLNTAKALAQHLGRPLEMSKTAFDPNDWRSVTLSNEGMCKMPLTTYDGVRVGSREYVRAAEKSCKGLLKIRLNTLATRVILDSRNRAVGIEYMEGKRLYRADRDRTNETDQPFRTGVVRAAREVILSGGAFNTPQLLMLSGIGPRQDLDNHEVPVRVDLPGVGNNLQDNYTIGVTVKMKQDADIQFRVPDPGQSSYRLFDVNNVFATTNGAVFSLLKRSHPDLLQPDLFIFGVPGRFSGYFLGYSSHVTDQSSFSWIISRAHQANTSGIVRLKSKDPRDRPEINFHYFSEGNTREDEDLQSLTDGLAFVRSVSSTDWITSEVLPGPAVRTREQLAEFVKANAWGHNASCTCRMGAVDDPMAVVDSRFRVRGVENLRIVDASIFPRIPGFFIVSAIYMASEKAADVIHEDATCQGKPSVQA